MSVSRRFDEGQCADLPTAIWSGSFNLLGVDVKCHTLSDGQRIVEAESFHALLEAVGLVEVPGGLASVPDFARFAQWQRGGVS